MARYEPGDYVKAEFKDGRTGESEWMWMRVESCSESGRLVFGWLDNQPVVDIDDLCVGQRLAVDYGSIRDHRKASEFHRDRRDAAIDHRGKL